MGSPAVTLGIFESLPPRPPTPPRETNHDSSVQFNRFLGSVDSRANLHTPPSAHSPDSIETASSHRAGKKVGFSGQAEYRDPPIYVDGEIEKHRPTPVSLPSSSSKPIKSILKQTASLPSPVHPQTSHTFGDGKGSYDWPTMLESALQHLAGSDRDSKVDAYMMLTRALKESNDLPDRVRLHQQIHLLLQFVQRDIALKTSDGFIDSTKLVIHALGLLNVFLRLDGIARVVYQDMAACIFIVDHCIRSFEDCSIAKDVTRHLMQVIVNQDFPSKVMTSDRVGRLVSSLHKIEEHHSGKSIILSRVIIYRKLVRQVKQQMIIHSDWLLDLFTDMLSTVKDIRSSAINLGLEAAFTLNQERALSRRVMEIMKLTSEDQKYIEYYRDRLKEWVKDKQQSSAVPRIWSVVVILLRCPSFDKWEFFPDWLMIIQLCFNSSDFQTKNEANYAWNRLVYIAMMDERLISDSKKRMNILSRPLCDQLTRKGTNRQMDDLRSNVLGGACNLFYYAFKPTVNLALLDHYWDCGVQPLLTQLIHRKPDDNKDLLPYAVRILTGLFDSTRSRIWKDDRVADSPIATPEELPAIDAKWTRRNAARVFAAVEPILSKNFLELGSTKSATFKLWKTLVSTIATAASKEIKVSIDTAAFLAEAFNVISKIWKQGLPPTEEAEVGAKRIAFLEASRAYLQIMTSALGTLPFREKMLATDKRRKFVPVSTPSHRTAKSQSHPKAPLYHLFALMSTFPPNIPDDAVFANFILAVFASFFESKGAQAQAELAQDLLSSLPVDSVYPYGPWILAAERIFHWLDSKQDSGQSAHSGSETPNGHEHREVVRVLERGIRSMPGLPVGHWNALFSALCECVRSDSGDAGVAMLVVEPLAKVMLDLVALEAPLGAAFGYLKYTNVLLAASTQPRDRQAVDAARRRLWGTVAAAPRSSSFDTFDNLYGMSNSVLEILYTNFGTIDSIRPADFIRELKGFFNRSNPVLLPKTILLLQHGISYWLKDAKRVLGPQCSDALSEVVSLWDKLASLLPDINHPDQQLEALETLLVAAFTSSHRSIQNITVSCWNRMMANVEEVQYPAQLKPVLISMQQQTSIHLPGLELVPEEMSDVQAGFVDSQEVVSLPKISPAASSRRTVRSSLGAPRSSSPVTSKLSKAQGAQDVTSRAAVAKPRLRRHEDSQIQFAPVESSPGDVCENESQVFTDRQREVRDRQRANAGLFPEIRSSPRLSTETAHLLGSSSLQQEEKSPDLPRASTPEVEGVYDEFVSSTPTPRRGRPVILSDHDMSDPPSSPPEPRGNPLAAEIRSRSASNSLRDEWQFSSSPTTGSPNLEYRPSILVTDQDDTFGDISLPDAHYAPDDEVMDRVEQAQADAVSTDPQKKSVNNSAVLNAENSIDPESEVALQPAELEAEKSATSSAPELQHQDRFDVAPKLLTTPPRLRAAQNEESPVSDHDVFVDARSSPAGDGVNSPLPPTPKRSKRIANRAKSSPLEFVVEVDGGKVDSSAYRQTTESPEKPLEKPPKKRRGAGALDCIVVGDSPESIRLRGRGSRKAKSSPIPVPTPMVTSPITSSSQPRGRGRPKRKRADSYVEESDGKRRRSRDTAPQGSADSQAIPMEGTLLQNRQEEFKAMRPPDMPVEELYEENMASSSLGTSAPHSPVEVFHITESQIPEEILESYVNDSAMDIDSPLDSPTPAMQEELIQSQIASESQSQNEKNDEIASLARSQQEEEQQPENADADLGPTIDGRLTENEDAVATSQNKPAQEQEQLGVPPISKAQSIMDALRVGLDGLQTANAPGEKTNLFREDIYKLEDMLMDVKRELFEAEKRGRT